MMKEKRKTKCKKHDKNNEDFPTMVTYKTASVEKNKKLEISIKT